MRTRASVRAQQTNTLSKQTHVSIKHTHPHHTLPFSAFLCVLCASALKPDRWQTLYPSPPLPLCGKPHRTTAVRCMQVCCGIGAAVTPGGVTAKSKSACERWRAFALNKQTHPTTKHTPPHHHTLPFSASLCVLCASALKPDRSQTLCPSPPLPLCGKPNRTTAVQHVQACPPPCVRRCVSASLSAVR